MLRPIYWEGNQVVLIDQTKLPQEEVWLTCDNYRQLAVAIRDMQIREAPAIGVAAALGIALAAPKIQASNFNGFFAQLTKICDEFEATRPTAVNLGWALEKMKSAAQQHRELPLTEIKSLLVKLAQQLATEDITINKRMGACGNALVPDKCTILTHCNAGALATAGYGTALGVIRSAVAAGKKVSVFATETRPFLQGARLTTWELQQDKIAVTLICDNMAGYFMKKGALDLVIVGADRIVANGDTANKIGTYTLAVLAKEHQLPFYIAAPISTIDFSIASGEEIVIEKRAATEVTHINGKSIAPQGTKVAYPAFDVTPNEYISAIITELGVARPPYIESLAQLKSRG